MSVRQAEDALQNRCWYWYSNEFCLPQHQPRGIIYAVPNGGKRDPVEAKRLRLTGTLAGVSDLHLILPNGKFLFVEMKLPDGKQSDVQLDFQNRVEAFGYRYYIIRTIEQFKEMVYNELGLRPL